MEGSFQIESKRGGGWESATQSIPLSTPSRKLIASWSWVKSDIPCRSASVHQADQWAKRQWHHRIARMESEAPWSYFYQLRVLIRNHVWSPQACTRLTILFVLLRGISPACATSNSQERGKKYWLACWLPAFGIYFWCVQLQKTWQTP